MKIVVCGGSGFLGSHVADALSDEGHDVVIFDLSESPYLRSNQKMIIGSILDKKAVKKVFKEADVIYNLAGVADIEAAKYIPLDVVESNILGNTILLDAAKDAGVKRFLFASTIYVFSNSGLFYRSSKKASENITEDYSDAYGLDYTILRFGSLYGGRADDKNFIHTILKSAIQEGKIVRYGDGEEIREYIHVQDAARCSVDALGEKYINQVITIAGHQSMRVKTLLEMIKEILGGKIEIDYRPVEDNRSPYDPMIHYKITPYNYNPKLGVRMFSNHYIDLGEGLISCIQKIVNESEQQETE